MSYNFRLLNCREHMFACLFQQKSYFSSSHILSFLSKVTLHTVDTKKSLLNSQHKKSDPTLGTSLKSNCTECKLKLERLERLERLKLPHVHSPRIHIPHS